MQQRFNDVKALIIRKSRFDRTGFFVEMYLCKAEISTTRQYKIKVYTTFQF